MPYKKNGNKKLHYNSRVQAKTGLHLDLMFLMYLVGVSGWGEEESLPSSVGSILVQISLTFT